MRQINEYKIIYSVVLIGKSIIKKRLIIYFQSRTVQHDVIKV